MSAPLVLGLAWLVLAAPLPDGLDHLRSGDVRPNIELLLDASGSMTGGSQPTSCGWFATVYNGGNTTLNKNEMLRAALVGCASDNDGLLDIWDGRVNFSIYKFGHARDAAALVAPFGADLASMKAGAASIPASSNTPMSFAIGESAKYMQGYLRDSNTLACRSNFILLLSDGDPNGGDATYNFNCPVPGDPRVSKNVPAMQPWLGSGYLTEHRDLLCAVTGEQQIQTYTLGFGAPGSFSPTNLQQIAQRGHGEYFDAANIDQLSAAFEAIISKMASRNGLFFAAPSVQLDQLHTGNDVYVASFKPHGRGRWGGTVKRHCVEPRLLRDGSFDPTDVACLFRADPTGRTLYTNPGVVDAWTGTTTTAAEIGGASDVLQLSLGAAGGAPRTPVRPRNLLTWRAGQNGYVAVQPSTWTPADSGAAAGEHPKLLNFLHGYTWDARPDGSPVAVSDAPLGDPVHSPTVLLRYAESCDRPGRCWVVVGMNDGMLHFFDAADGSESSALIPAEAWLANSVGKERLLNLRNQPDMDVTHRYFVDGGMILYHVDGNGDGIIQSSETASLVFGLGRGGAAYFQIPVTRFDGRLSSTGNPVLPLQRTPNTALADLSETWATPWAGTAKVDGQTRGVAVFPTGHVRAFDEPAKRMPGLVPVVTAVAPQEQSIGCAAVANAQGLPPSACMIWNGRGYADPAPQNVYFGPFALPGADAYQLRFVGFDLDPRDRLELLDSQGSVLETFSRSGPTDGLSAWISDRSFSLRWVTNGRRTANRGWHVGQIHYREPGSAAVMEPHHPAILMLDLARWNGGAARSFASAAADGGVLLQVSRSCTGSVEHCLDAQTDPDLEEMTCPITGDPAIYTVAGALKAIYWGDECGQLFKAYSADDRGSVWRARKLLSLNRTGSLASPTAEAGQSKDLRKIFRKLDLVPSGCPGRRVVGVYFGSGNVQRPAATDELSDATLTNGRDVIGALWDTDDLPGGLTIDDLEDASRVVEIDPRAAYARGKHGWFISLEQNERMLRDPLVFESVAYFKTFRPVSSSAECRAAAGVDAVYAVNNCSASPAVGSEIADRKVWSGETDVGGGLMLFTPKSGAPMVTHGNLLRSDRAALVEQRRGRIPRIFLWREPGRKG